MNAVTKPAKVKVAPYYCQAALRDGRTRCRQESVPGTEPCLCAQHEAMSAAGRPIKLATHLDIVLFKFKVNKKEHERLEKLGVETFPRQDVAAMDKAHAEHAEEHDRSPTAIREKPDSGCQVFGEQGVQNANCRQMPKELGNDFPGTKIHMQETDNSDRFVLVLSFAIEGESTVSDPVWAEVEKLNDRVWKYAHVWVNPPKDGKVIATINVGGWPGHPNSREGRAREVLHLDGGLFSTKVY